MAAKTLAKMQEEVGVKTQLVDKDGEFVDGNVTKDNVTSFLNNRKNELYLKIMNKYPEGGQEEEMLTLSAGESFIPFSDLSLSQVVLNYVGIKYGAAQPDFTKVNHKEHNVLFRRSTSTKGISPTSPKYSFKREGDELGIKIYPAPSETITDGVLVQYVLLPEDLFDPTDIPFGIPVLLHPVLVAYAIADVWETKRDWANSNQALNRAIMLEDKFFENYDPIGSDLPGRISVNKTFYPFTRR